MTAVVLVIHVLLAIALVAVILLQRSEGGALGIGGGPGGLMSARGAGNVLTRVTAVIAVCFMLTSIGLTFIEAVEAPETSIAEEIQKQQQDSAPTPADEPAESSKPAVPLAE